MKKKKLLTGLLVSIAAIAACIGLVPMQPLQSATKPLITVMNPAITSRMATRQPISPRLKTLEGKTLYLVDIGWGGPEAAYGVYEEMKAWFAEKMPSVKIVIKRKSGMYIMPDQALWNEIRQNGDAALIGISG